MEQTLSKAYQAHKHGGSPAKKTKTINFFNQSRALWHHKGQIGVIDFFFGELMMAVFRLFLFATSVAQRLERSTPTLFKWSIRVFILFPPWKPSGRVLPLLFFSSSWPSLVFPSIFKTLCEKQPLIVLLLHALFAKPVHLPLEDAAFSSWTSAGRLVVATRRCHLATSNPGKKADGCLEVEAVTSR